MAGRSLITNMIGVGSYAACAVAFVLLTLFIGFRPPVERSRRRERWALAGACIANVLWATVTSLQMTGVGPVAEVAFTESLRDGAWLWLLAGLLGASTPDRWTVGLQCLARGFPAVWLIWIVARWGGAILTGTPPPGLDFAWVVGGLCSALLGLALVEQIYRNLQPSRRWAVKYFGLGLGLIFAYDLYLYSYTLLMHAVDQPVWTARGAVDALAAPLIAVAVSRKPLWSADVFVSRRAAFHTATLTGVGFYLVAMAAGGYVLQWLGGSWGDFAAILFFAGASVLLVVVLFSGQARSRARVFLNKHFFDYKYDYRDEWLRLTRHLYSPRLYADPYERSVVALADIVESPGGALWMRRGGHVFEMVVTLNFHPPEAGLPADAPLVAFLEARQWIVDLAEHAEFPALYDDLVLPAWLARTAQAWLVVPISRDGELSGIAVLARSRAPMALNWEDHDLLKAVGQQVGGFLAHHEASRALAEARQFEAYNRVTTFLMHDLKNIMAQQSLLVKNAERHKDNPAFVADMIDTVSHSVERMGRLLEQLRRGAVPSEETGRIDAVDIVRRVLQRAGEHRPVPRLVVEQSPALVRADADTFMMVVSHILRNAQEACDGDGGVSVRVAAREQRIMIEVVDDGCGMDGAFVRERLFEPFFTTKSSRGMGIGAYQARAFARAAGGDVEVDSEPGRGTCFRLWLPRAPAEAAYPVAPAGA